jgi:hypothetical protein
LTQYGAGPNDKTATPTSPPAPAPRKRNGARSTSTQGTGYPGIGRVQILFTVGPDENVRSFPPCVRALLLILCGRLARDHSLSVHQQPPGRGQIQLQGFLQPLYVVILIPCSYLALTPHTQPPPSDITKIPIAQNAPCRQSVSLPSLPATTSDANTRTKPLNPTKYTAGKERRRLQTTALPLLPSSFQHFINTSKRQHRNRNAEA